LQSNKKEIHHLEDKDNREMFLRFSLKDSINDKNGGIDFKIKSINYNKKITITTDKNTKLNLDDFVCKINTPGSPLIESRISLIKNDIIGVVKKSADNYYSFIGEIDNNTKNKEINFINLKNVICFNNLNKIHKV
jgi:hypothetical protein